MGDRPGLKQDKRRNLYAGQSVIQGCEGSSGGGQGGGGDLADEQQLSSASDAIRKRQKASCVKGDATAPEAWCAVTARVP